MDFDIKKLATIVAEGGPSLGLAEEEPDAAVGVLFFKPCDMDKVKAFFPSLTGARP